MIRAPTDPASEEKQKRRATYWQATTAMADCRPPSPNPEEE